LLSLLLVYVLKKVVGFSPHPRLCWLSPSNLLWGHYLEAFCLQFLHCRYHQLGRCLG
jgi:hypothetical protein